MTQRSYKPLLKRLHSEERGVYFVLLAICLVVLFGFAGLALDTANLQRTRLNLQKALDSGVVAGLGYRIDVGPFVPTAPGADEDAYALAVLTHASRVAIANARNANYLNPNTNAPIATIEAAGNVATSPPTGFVGDQGDLTAEVADKTFFNQETETLSLALHYEADLWLMDKFDLFGFGDFHRLLIVSEGTLNPAYVSLALDFSGSMQCMTTSTTCGPADLRPGDAGNKAAALKSAVVEFLDRFKDGRDFVQLVPFNIRAQIPAGYGAANELNTQGGGVPVTAGNRWQDIVQTFVEKSNTNPSDAFAKARADWPGAIFNQRPISYVYFSDGAPTAGRFTFTDTRGGLGGGPFYHYKVEWKLGASTRVDTSGLITVGAGSPLGFDLGYDQSRPPGYSWADSDGDPTTNDNWVDADGPKDLNNIMPECSKPLSAANIVSGGLIHDFPRFDYAFGACLRSLSFTVGGQTYGNTTEIPSTEWATVTEADADWQIKELEWLKEYYNVTIAWSDFLRANLGTFYTIGLGEPACRGCVAYGTANQDPYQNLAEDNLRKDIFLARIANDPYWMARNGLGTVDFDMGNINSTWANIADASEGEYLETSDAAALNRLFNRVSRRILLRLIS